MLTTALSLSFNLNSVPLTEFGYNEHPTTMSNTILISMINKLTKQECIPVGCVPSAAVAISGGGVSARGGCTPPTCGQTDTPVKHSLSATAVADGNKWGCSIELILTACNEFWAR